MFKTSRERYLLGTLKLNHDPFMNPSAEKELQIKPEDPPFFSYFVETPYESEDNKPLLDKLQESGTAIVYGKSGSGKTTLRYMLEWMCRSMLEQTLVVSYNIGKGEPLNLDTSAHWNKLAQEVAVELFIQVLEQFDSLRPDRNPDFIRIFGQYWQQHIPNFSRKIDIHLVQYRRDEIKAKKEQVLALEKAAKRKEIPHTQAQEPGVFIGVSEDISTWWQVWDRPAVRYTSLSPDMQAFLSAILSVRINHLIPETGKDAVVQGLELAKYLDYKQVFLLVDVVGATKEEDLNIESLLAFLTQLESFAFPVGYKSFLPNTFEAAVSQFFIANRLPQPRFSAIIKWVDPKVFNKLISNRLQRASKWIHRLDTIMDQEVAAQFNNMIEENGRTPRQILQTISYLIDAHARHAADNYQITLDDWKRMEEDWFSWE